MPDNSLALAKFIALFADTVLYGLFLATFTITLRVLFWDRTNVKWKSLQPAQWWLSAVAISQFILCTTHLALDLYQDLDVFVYSIGSSVPEDTLLHRTWVDTAEVAILELLIFLGEGALMYRCFVVYARSWRVIAVPILVFISGIICAVASLITAGHTSSGVAEIESRLSNEWLDASVGLILFGDTCTSGLIIIRIWKTWKSHTRSSLSSHLPRRSPLWSAIIIFVESGLLVTISAIFVFVAMISRSVLLYPASAIMGPLLGIAFDLIVIRVHGRKEEASTSASYPLRFRPAKSPTFVCSTDMQESYRTPKGEEVMGGIKKAFPGQSPVTDVEV